MGFCPAAPAAVYICAAWEPKTASFTVHDDQGSKSGRGLLVTVDSSSNNACNAALTTRSLVNWLPRAGLAELPDPIWDRAIVEFETPVEASAFGGSLATGTASDITASAAAAEELAEGGTP